VDVGALRPVTRAAIILRPPAALALVAAALLLLSVPSLAGARPPAPRGATKAQMRQIARLETLTHALAAEVAALESRAPESGPAGGDTAPASTPTPPAVLPFSAPAGGAFTGSFPDPRLAPASVGAAQLAPESVTSSSIADGSLTGAELEAGSIAPPAVATGAITTDDLPSFSGSAEHMLPAIEWPPPGDATGSVFVELQGAFKRVSLSCPPGFSVLSGGWEWSNEDDIGTRVVASHPFEGIPGNGGFLDQSWEWDVGVARGGSDNTFLPKLLCLTD
jgi:hypothetical protein